MKKSWCDKWNWLPPAFHPTIALVKPGALGAMDNYVFLEELGALKHSNTMSTYVKFYRAISVECSHLPVLGAWASCEKCKFVHPDYSPRLCTR